MTTATAFPPRALPSPRSLLAAEPRFAVAGLVIALSLAVTIAAAAIDPRLFHGENVWYKPIRFQLAFALYLLTLAVFAHWLPSGMTARRSYRIYSGLVAAAMLAELVWIGGAAMHGIASHFNDTSVVMMRLYSLMGMLAILLLSASLVYGIAIGRNRASGLPPALRLSLALGLVLTFALTLPVALTMGNMPSGHLIGTPVTGAHVPVIGWSREVGDLRAVHFFATHSMQFLPVAGLLAVVLLPPRVGVAAVWVAALLFAGFVYWAFTGALAGRPLIPLA